MHILQAPTLAAGPPPAPAIGPAHAHALAELLIAFRPRVFGVPRQHALDAHADALDALHRRPARRTQEVETYNPIAVDVRVDRDRPAGEG